MEILKAVALFDELGRDTFLDQFGFGKAREYFLVHNGRYYDSKAILGVAHQYEFPELGLLGSSDFSGGELTVKRKLEEELGFTVKKLPRSPGASASVTIPRAGLQSINIFPIGSQWRRADIHDLLGGQRQGGISTPADKPYIILFSSPRGEEFGYSDGWHDDGFYYYTGEGQEGDMTFDRGNRAIRDHSQDGKILLLFETFGQGQRRFVGPMTYVGHTIDRLPNMNGNDRDAIVFKLMETDLSAVVPAEGPESREALAFTSSRQVAIEASQNITERIRTAQERRKRSQTIARYVQERALGYCEVCCLAAPFERADGTPYLESHHIMQVADDGPDAPRDVVAACPTCHKKIHHGIAGEELNTAAHERIQRVERAIDEGRLKIVTAAIILNETGQILLARRKHGQELGTKWEFPGGKVAPGETLAQCLKREILEELDLRIGEPRRFFMVDHTYATFDIRLCSMVTSIEYGAPALNAHAEIGWINPQDATSLDLAPADIKIAEALLNQLKLS